MRKNNYTSQIEFISKGKKWNSKLLTCIYLNYCLSRPAPVQDYPTNNVTALTLYFYDITHNSSLCYVSRRSIGQEVKENLWLSRGFNQKKYNYS